MSHASSDGHTHPHPSTHLSAVGGHTRRLQIVLGLTAAYMLAEVVGGLLTNSLALLADAGHMLTDVLGLSMALIAIRFAQRPATPAKTYGFYRLEILAALANALILFGVAGYILYEAWQRLREPPEVSSLPMLVIAIGGLVVNLVGIRLLHAGSGESLNVKGAYLEVVSDLLGSVGVIIAALVISVTGWTLIDPIMSALIGLFILPRTWGLLRSVVDVLLEATPSGVDVADMQQVLESVPGVQSVHDLHVWTITSGFVAMSGHVTARGRSSEDVLHDLQAVVRSRFGIQHATLQVESADHADGGACCAVDPRCLVVGQQARRLTAGQS
jgi:cobalt-zinc-cadmium efflux system protein